MKNETRAWLSYADENLASAIILLEQVVAACGEALTKRVKGRLVSVTEEV